VPACKKFCATDAIDFEQKDRIEEIEVGAIVLTTGFQVFDASKMTPYGYGRLPEVYSALEFERMNSASGPTGGESPHEERPKAQERSPGALRGLARPALNEHCSRVCCMYSLKFAHLIKERTGARVYNFYIDMRCFGKGYEQFYQRLFGRGGTFCARTGGLNHRLCPG